MVKIQSKYRDARPGMVLKWEQQITSATTHEEAQTPLLYELNLQALKLLRLVQWVAIAACVLVVLGVILVIVI